MYRSMSVLIIAAAVSATPVEAQILTRGRTVSDPTPGLPPAGMCRIWIDGVPAGRQSAPTDCDTARRRVPANGRVIYGPPTTSRSDRDDDRWDRDDDRWDRDDDHRGPRRDIFIDARGRECRRQVHVKKNGDRSTSVKCRNRNDRDGRWDDDRRDDDDRWHDRGRRDDDVCRDANRDGRCDYGQGGASRVSFPDMIGAVVYGRTGRRTSDVERWLGSGRYQVRYTDADRNGRPERVNWLNGAGQLVQSWIDVNRDGRADSVRLYRDGRLVREVR
jgi:hypothetical protein